MAKDENRWFSVWERIRPYYDEEVEMIVKELKNDSSFQAFIRFFPSDLLPILQAKMEKVPTTEYFRKEIIAPLLGYLLQRTTFSFDLSGTSNLKGLGAVTFLSNHRDIILDAAILNLCLFQSGYNLVRMAVGDNLLKKPFITKLMKLADAILVERSLPPRAFVESSRAFSAFVEKSISEENKSIWIAQREGRAKDNDDKTQPALLKMLALEGNGDTIEEKLLSKKIVPMTISYEYDPCDFLKAKELLYRKKYGSYTKSRNEDINSMRQGLLGKKGRIHINLGTPLASLINKAKKQNDSMVVDFANINTYLAHIASLIDIEIHSHYRLYPGNYIADDLLKNSTLGFKNGHYSKEDESQFTLYLEERVQLASPASDSEAEDIRKLILLQYANPLRNYFLSNAKEMM